MTRAWTRDEYDRSLQTRLDQLMRGQILIQDLPPAVSAWFFAGEAYGRASRQPEIDQLQRDVNRYYNLAFTTPQQRRDDLDRRLAQALDQADETVWQQIEADLQLMAGRQPNNEPQHSISAAQAAREEPPWQQQQKNTSGPQGPNSAQSAHGRRRAA